MWDKVLDANPIADAIALDLDYRNDRYRALDSGVLVEKPWSDIVNNYSAPAGRTYFDSSGVLQTAAANTPIRAFDPATGELLGNHIWGSYTCLNHHSFDPTNSAWIVTGATRTPYGSAVGEFTPVYVESTGGTWNRLLATFMSGQSSYVVRCLYSAGTSGRFRITCRDTANSLETQLAGTVSGTKTFITSAAGPVTIISDRTLLSGIRETVISFTPNTPGTGVSFGFGPDSVVSGESVLLYGACVYAGLAVPPLVKTSGASLPIAAENQIIDGSVFSDIWNESGVSVFAKVRSNYNSDASMILSAGTAFDNWVALRRLRGSSPLNYPDAVVTPVGGGSPAAFSASTAAAASLENIAFSIKDSEFAYFARNGSVSTTPPFIPGMPTVTQMELGFRAFGTPYHLNGYIERLVMFNRALPPSILQRLTA